MTERPEPNHYVMLNLFQHLICFFCFHPRPRDGVLRCGLNKFQGVEFPTTEFEEMMDLCIIITKLSIIEQEYCSENLP
jgi:hypothetical protein